MSGQSTLERHPLVARRKAVDTKPGPSAIFFTTRTAVAPTLTTPPHISSGGYVFGGSYGMFPMVVGADVVLRTRPATIATGEHRETNDLRHQRPPSQQKPSNIPRRCSAVLSPGIQELSPPPPV